MTERPLSDAVLDAIAGALRRDADQLAELLLARPGHSPHSVLALLGATVDSVAKRLPDDERDTTLRNWLEAFKEFEK